jgi:hypothetical protein
VLVMRRGRIVGEVDASSTSQEEIMTFAATVADIEAAADDDREARP